MKAFVHDKNGLHLSDMEEPKAGKGEVVVKIAYAGLNRRDLYIPNRRGEKPDRALILGSDASGIIESIGEGVQSLAVGDEVIVNPSLRWEQNTPAPPAEFDILGMPDHGTFAEKVVIHAAQLEKKPAYLSMEEASVIALSGMTGYRALFTRGALQAGQTVLIPGAGSGVATFLIQFAKKAGARVIVTSRSKVKRDKALELGADLAIDTVGDWGQELAEETIDLIIDSVGRATFQKSIKVLKKGGCMVIFGATTEDTAELDLRTFFYSQQDLRGSTMASKEELQDMLAFMAEHKIHPVVDGSMRLEDAASAFQKLEDNHQFGKITLKI